MPLLAKYIFSQMLALMFIMIFVDVLNSFRSPGIFAKLTVLAVISLMLALSINTLLSSKVFRGFMQKKLFKIHIFSFCVTLICAVALILERILGGPILEFGSISYLLLGALVIYAVITVSVICMQAWGNRTNPRP